MRRPAATHHPLLAALAAAALLGACSSGTSVGGEELTRGLGDAVDLERLGGPTEQLDATPSRSPSGTDASPTQVTSATSPASAPTSDAGPNPATSLAPAITISIHPDGAQEQQFSPRIATVRPGSIIRWVNQDSVERSVVAQDQSFVSPPIPPGDSWSHTFEVAGRFDYHDGTRVYVLGTVEVVP